MKQTTCKRTTPAAKRLEAAMRAADEANEELESVLFTAQLNALDELLSPLLKVDGGPRLVNLIAIYLLAAGRREQTRQRALTEMKRVFAEARGALAGPGGAYVEELQRAGL